jgi:glycosyltransferase involved in cell wall biosynthesis
MLLLINNLLNSMEYDLIHADTIGMYPYSLPLKNRNIILNHHNIESNMMSRRHENEKNIFKREYFRKEAVKLRKYERYACSNCAKNFVVSDLDALRLKNIVGDIDITVVPNGVDTEYFKTKEPLGKKDGGLIFAGPMDWYPNREAIFYFLSEIWPKLREDDPERKITIVGKNPPKELIIATRNSRISAPGFVDDIRPYIDSASIYICPIKNGGGTRLKILDALAMGKPLVATKLAVEGLHLTEEEHYLLAETGSEFVSQVKRLEEDEELRKRLALAGRQLVEKRYSWEIIGKAVNIAYQEAILR